MSSHRQELNDREIGEQSRYLCSNYIEARFNRSDLCLKAKNRLPETFEASCSPDVLNTLCEMGELLETTYPLLFNNIVVKEAVNTYSIT